LLEHNTPYQAIELLHVHVYTFQLKSNSKDTLIFTVTPLLMTFQFYSGEGGRAQGAPIVVYYLRHNRAAK
jgi:hypothetical protein